MAAKTVLVTGIGGNVGQGIIRNIRSLSYDIRIIGTNICDFSSGNYLCDEFYRVPYAYEDNFIRVLLDIVKKEKVDLVIPSTDYETFYLAASKAQFPCEIAVSGKEAARLYLDKYETWQHHQKYGIPFAESYEPSHYKGQFKNYIVKPKKGRGSRGIFINPKDLGVFSDTEYMVQELHEGPEITTAFYVARNKKLHGYISLERSLENGMTTLCKVSTAFNHLILPVLEKMIANTDIKGSVNVQSIATADGRIVPFEVNCRISGTNSIRSNFGFKDVQYTLQEYLYNIAPDKPEIIDGVAVRVLLDVIYPNQKNYPDLSNSSNPHYIF